MIRFVLCGSVASAAVIAATFALVMLMNATIGNGPQPTGIALAMTAGVAGFVFVGIPAIWWGVYLSLDRGWNAIGKRLSENHRRRREGPPL